MSRCVIFVTCFVLKFCVCVCVCVCVCICVMFEIACSDCFSVGTRTCRQGCLYGAVVF